MTAVRIFKLFAANLVAAFEAIPRAGIQSLSRDIITDRIPAGSRAILRTTTDILKIAVADGVSASPGAI